MQPAGNKESTNRLDAIIEGASKLSVEEQKLILAVIEGMVFTKRHLQKREVQDPANKNLKSGSHDGVNTKELRSHFVYL